MVISLHFLCTTRVVLLQASSDNGGSLLWVLIKIKTATFGGVRRTLAFGTRASPGTCLGLGFRVCLFDLPLVSQE